MEKNQTSCPKAVCEKIFRAITFGPAFSTIRRISNRQQTPSPAKLNARNNPSLPNSDPPLKTFEIKTPKPASKDGSELLIKFDYTPHSVQNNNGQVPVVRMTEKAKKPKPAADMVQSGKPTPGVASSRIQPETSVLTGQNTKSKAKAEKGKGNIQVQFERNAANKDDAGKKPTHVYYEDRFTAFIHRTKKKIMSHDQEQGENSPMEVGNSHGHGLVKDHHIQDYIDKTKRKIRTTSSLKDRNESFFK